jgi:hypothetical protein
MACFLCAYALPQAPKRRRGLPANSPAPASDPLGTCNMCGVHACSQHGERYSQFECAICSPAKAAQTPITQPPSGQTVEEDATEQAVVASVLAPVLPQVAEVDDGILRRGLERLVTEYRQLAERRERLGAPLPHDPETLVGGLEDWLMRRYWREADQAEDQSVWRLPGISPIPDAEATGLSHGRTLDLHNLLVGATVRRILGASEPRSGEVSSTDVAVARGAIGLAYETVAEDPHWLDPERGMDFAVRGLVPPWRLSVPGAVHPMVWLLAAAYISAAEE